MPFSTSPSSSRTVPLASRILKESSRPRIHAAAGRRSGKATPHAGANEIARPGGAGSSLNVTWQRRSRSGFDNSHGAATSTRATSFGSGSGAGACASADAPDNVRIAIATSSFDIAPPGLILRSFPAPDQVGGEDERNPDCELCLLHRRLGNRRERALAGEP